MLSEPSFSDRAITDEFYETLFDRFYLSFPSSIQVLLKKCTYGIVADRSGTRTLFLIAADVETATDLKQHVETVVDRIADVMPGIAKTAICFLPPDRANNPQPKGNCNTPPSKFMMGQVFPVPSKTDICEA